MHPFPVLNLKGKFVSNVSCGDDFVMCLGKNIKKEVQSQGKITIKSGEQRKSRSKGSRNKSNLRDQKVQLKTHNNRRNEPMLVSVAAQ
jgi:hypothetical protein